MKNKEERDDFIWRIITYGATGDFNPPDNEFALNWFETICEYIDKKKGDYNSKIEGGKYGGREKKFDREEVKRLIAQGKNGKQIGQILGVSDTAIYHDKVWLERNKYNCYRN